MIDIESVPNALPIKRLMIRSLNFNLNLVVGYGTLHTFTFTSFKLGQISHCHGIIGFNTAPLH